MKQKSIILLIIFVLFNCFIFAEALMPGDSSGAQSDSIAGVFSDIIKNNGKDDYDYIKPTKIEVTSSNTMVVGETKKITTKIIPDNVTNSALNFESLSPEFASVDINGNVYAIKAGTATIRITADDDQNVSVDFNITITEKAKVMPTAISFKKTSFETKNMRALYLPDVTGGIEFIPNNCTEKNVRYEVENGTLQGNYLLVNNPGEFMLKAIANSDSSVSCEMKIKVLEEEAKKPTSISIKSGDVFINRKTPLDITFDSEDIEDKSLIFISDNSIVNYSVDNNLRGVKEGETEIKVCSVFNSSVCSNSLPIEVKKVELEKLEIKVNESELEYFKSGAKINLSYSLFPSDVTYKEIEWSVNNDNAKISASGLLVGLKKGETVVKLTHLDSGKTVEKTIKIGSASTLNKAELDKLRGKIRKQIGHFGLFVIDGIIGFLFFVSLTIKKKNKVIFSCLTGLCIAVTAELLQLIPKDRSCQVSDMIINYAGYIFGLAFLFIVITIINKIKHKRNRKGEVKDE